MSGNSEAVTKALRFVGKQPVAVMEARQQCTMTGELKAVTDAVHRGGKSGVSA